MPVEERRRSRLYERLADAIGHDEAGTMFELLPPAGTDLVTTADLARLERRMEDRFATVDVRFEALDQRMEDRFATVDVRFDGLRTELTAVFRDELHREVGTLRGEVGTLRGEVGTLHGELGALRGELGALRDQLTGIAGTLGAQTRTLVIAMMSTALTVVAGAGALSRLL